MTTHRAILTREGKERLERELEELRTEQRPQVLQRLREAVEAAHGDVAHSAEFTEAKREQAFVEGRIAELERVLAEAKLVEAPPVPGVVGPGSTVVVTNELGEERFTLVGAAEADPRQGRISIESPVGRALLGRRAGEAVEVETPAGPERLVVLRVE